MHEGVVEAFAQCRSLEEFLAARAPLELHSQTPRFLHLELDIVNRCNIRCLMCYHSLESTRRVPTTYLSPEDFSLVASRILPHAYHLSLSLGNEPLMSPHFIPILRLAGGYAVPNVNFFTNGLLLDEEAGDAIVEHGVTQLCCSLDGATAATYNAIRRDSDFDKVIRNVTPPRDQAQNHRAFTKENPGQEPVPRTSRQHEASLPSHPLASRRDSIHRNSDFAWVPVKT